MSVSFPISGRYWFYLQEKRLQLISVGQDVITHSDPMWLIGDEVTPDLWGVYTLADIASTDMVARAGKRFTIRWDLRTDIWFGPVRDVYPDKTDLFVPDRFTFRDFTLHLLEE